MKKKSLVWVGVAWFAVMVLVFTSCSTTPSTATTVVTSTATTVVTPTTTTTVTSTTTTVVTSTTTVVAEPTAEEPTAEEPVIVETYANPDLLVETSWLNDHYNDADLVIIDCRPSADYDAGHIPNAINTQWAEYVDSDTVKSVLKPVADLEAILGEKGISESAKVIIYGDLVLTDPAATWGSDGQFFWMLEYLGHTDVHILNGGWSKWVTDAYTTATELTALPAASFAADVQQDILAEKDYLLSRLEDEDFVIIDPREDEEYNGWTRYGETRGGHIDGAVSINYKWFFNDDETVLSYEDIKDVLESRGVTPDKEITAYGTGGDRSGFIYFVLRLMGYTNISDYDGAIYEWSADPDCPMDMLPKYYMLVYPEWVEELIAGNNPPTYEGNDYVIIEDMSQRGGDNTSDYDKGHIPGAIHLNRYMLEPGYPVYPYCSPKDGNLLPSDQLQKVIGNLGITPDTLVIVYTSASPSARTQWALMYAGVKDVRTLNGGYAAWVEHGGAAETTTNTPTPVDFGDVPVHPEYNATTADVAAMLKDPDAVVADMRDLDEFLGDPGSNGYIHHGFVGVEGRIPGSVWVDGSAAYRDAADKTFRSYTEVAQLWADAGITADTNVVFY